ncbi:MAG TPA: fibro-slime domain-containing protein [Polyangiaceae bacterium]|nr:fibro-slime domain-containing protein [Polyangiaceae bacterium]
MSPSGPVVRALVGVAAASVLALLAVGCSSTSSGEDTGPAVTPGTGGAPPFVGIAGTQGGSNAVGPGNPGITTPVPSVFVKADIGGYALGAPTNGDVVSGGTSIDPDGGTGCNVMLAIVRDFKGINEDAGHPDFEAFSGKDATTGLVAAELGADRKPVYASRCEASPDKASCPYGQMTTSKPDFDEWYRFTDGVNKPYQLFLQFDANHGVYTFASTAFFPLDDAGWGNSPHKSHHNFGFTTELHTRFAYNGGEVFSFTGDDDLWVFVNGKLAIDLGGLHPSKSRTLDLDASSGELGIVKGQSYDLELFHAERHSANSDFRVDTTLSFTNCGTVVPEIR